MSPAGGCSSASDLNVPLEDGQVADDTRIRASLPTLELLLERGAAEVVVCSHLGRPKGEDPAFAMRRSRPGCASSCRTSASACSRTRASIPARRRTTRILRAGSPTASTCSSTTRSARRTARTRLRSESRELLPAYAGLLLERELEELGKLLGEVERPFVLISGGAKVEDKLGVLEHLGGRADHVLIGGKMAEQVRVENPLTFEVQVPTDVVAAAEFAEDAESKVVPYDDLPNGWLGLDIGPETREAFARTIAGARTVFWNGPMGVFEWPRFAEGTKSVAEAVAKADAHTVVGGADSIRALTELGLVDEVDWASTGGGASLELLEGKELPGVAAIPEE